MSPKINKILRSNDQNDKLQRTIENRDILLTGGIDPGDVVEDQQKESEALGSDFQQV